MRRIVAVLGHEHDRATAERLHRHQHDDQVEIVELSADDAQRHHLRVVTDHGRELAISLPRDQHLDDGSVLVLDDDLSVIVRIGHTDWVRLTPLDTAAALALGHRAGHLHWRVRFDGGDLLVACDGTGDAISDRISDLTANGSVTVTP
jgi:urease accessory protein